MKRFTKVVLGALILVSADTIAAVPASARVMVGIGAPVTAHAPGPACNPYSPNHDLYYCGYGPAYVGGPAIGFGDWHGSGFHGGNFDGVGFHGGHRQSPIMTTKGSVHRSVFCNSPQLARMTAAYCGDFHRNQSQLTPCFAKLRHASLAILIVRHNF